MGLECGCIKGLEGVGRGLERDGEKELYVSRRCGEGRVAADF